MNFIHLHVHTQYSLLDGAAEIERAVSRAAELGMPAMAVTDHGVMYGALKFYQAAKKTGIKPIMGCETYVARRSRFDKTARMDDDPYHLVLLAMNGQGYRNLLKLVSMAHLEGFYYKPRIDREILARYSEGLIASSACLAGEIPRMLLAGDEKGLQDAVNFYRELFPGRFYLEVQDQGLADQQKLNRMLFALGKDSGLPLVATNDVHYLEKEDARVQDILLCIQTGKTLQDPGRLRFATDEFYLKSAEQMLMVFGERPEVLENTLKIAEQCNLSIPLGEHHLPEYNPPEGYTLDDYLARLCRENLSRHYPSGDSAVEERLQFELETIKKMGFAGYFLIVWDLIRESRSRGIAVGPGRGSAAGSLVSYLLGITQLDPIKYGLLFERFLNPERVSMPDIDIDFCFERRGEVLDYVKGKYGEERVAQIITFGTMAARAAIRDVGRVMGLPYGEVDRLAKLVPYEFGIDLERALAISPDLKTICEENVTYRDLMDIAQKIEGFPRHASVHAAGVVISKDPLTAYLPLTRTSEGEIATQFPMEDVEKIGLLKMDFLGLRTLTVIRDTLALLRQSDAEIDLEKIPLDDADTFRMFQTGQTLGVFQFESAGMQRMLADFRPDKLGDLILLNAAYRPGPMAMIPTIIEIKHGRKKPEYLHPLMEPVLAETYGVIVYQEQVMQLVQRLANFTLARADLLRRAMGKKKEEIMRAERESFLAGCKSNGIAGETAHRIYDLIAEFANYGFNKSHSAAYALVAYWTAYLKVHYPQAFLAALITSVMGNSDKTSLYAEETRRLGVCVLPPDINKSTAHFTAEGKNIRFGLLAIKNLGEGAIRAIVEERGKGGSFTSIYDFCRRMESSVINRRALESLIKAGAFDSLGRSRRAMLEVMEIAIQQAVKNAPGNQLSFFDLVDKAGDLAPQTEVWPEVPEFIQEELLRQEREYVGMYISGHPLDPWREKLSHPKLVPLARITEEMDGQQALVAGILHECRRLVTKSGNQMATFKLEDLTGSMPVVVFPQLYQQIGLQLANDRIIAVKAKIDWHEEEQKLLAEEIRFMNNGDA
ncbi:MAG: DNA polymerase III subunit alpha [Bacillota bacterium]